MKALKLLGAILLLVFTSLVGCQSGAPGESGAERVVLVSYDGLGADMLWKWIEEAVVVQPDGFAAMAEHGLAARRLRMVDPTLTAAVHASLATGRPPADTGIVSNTFRHVGTPIDQRVSGFAAPWQVESLWAAARRQGKRAGVLLWPGSDARAIDRMADFGVLWPLHPILESAVLELDPEDAEDQPELPSHDGLPARSWRLELDLPAAEPAESELLVAVLDASPDGVPRYDQVAMRRSSELSWQYVEERGWLQLRVNAAGLSDLSTQPYGAWSKVLHLDRRRGNLRLYRGAFWRLIAYPADFQQDLLDAVGPWPGPPDGRELAEWWLDGGRGIDLDTYLEQLERLDRFIDSMAVHTFASESFDLLLSYHPAVDEYLHSSFIVDQRQWAYSPGRALAAREGLKRVAKSVDLSVHTLWRTIDPARDVLVVVSDHGLMPVHDLVNANRVLEQAGLLLVNRDGERPRLAEASPMVALTSASCAHLYLNLVGREPAGVVDPDDGPELLLRAARAFADLEVEGEPVVERVVNRLEAAELGLGHPDCGDLVVFLNPGFSFAHGHSGELITPSRTYAQHGYLSHHDAMAGMLFARGAGVDRGRRKELAATEVAPMVAFWMGLRFP